MSPPELLVLPSPFSCFGVKKPQVHYGRRCYSDSDMTYFTFGGTLGLNCGPKHIQVKPYHWYSHIFLPSFTHITPIISAGLSALV